MVWPKTAEVQDIEHESFFPRQKVKNVLIIDSVIRVPILNTQKGLTCYG